MRAREKADARRLAPYVSRFAAEWVRDEAEVGHRRVEGSLAFFDISGFTRLADRLLRSGKEGAEALTSVIDELPADMGEYIAAKTAGEALCGFLEQTHRDLAIHKPRLPRMATDQTASLLPVKNEDAVSIMLEHLRILGDLSLK